MDKELFKPEASTPLPAVLTKLLTRLLKKVAAFMIDEELAHWETQQYNDEMNYHNRSQVMILMWSCISLWKQLIVHDGIIMMQKKS